jgi:hypothetical protein
MTRSKQVVVVVAALFFFVSFSGCGNSNPTTPQQYGQIGIALVATGSDGTTYRLPAGAQVDLSSAQFDLLQQLGGNSPQIDVAVPPGEYAATLFDQNFETPALWNLDRLDAAGNVTGTVAATLVTTMPVAVIVTSSQTSSLVLAFSVPTGGSINFDRGTVAITLTVNQQQAQSFAFDASASLTVRSTVLPNGSPLAGVVPPVGTSGLSVEIGGPVTGSWTEFSGTAGEGTDSFTVCAPTAITTKIASGNTAFADFVGEIGTGVDPISLFGTSSLCVTDDGVQNFIRVRLSRVGAPTTPTYSVLGSGPFQFRLILQAVLPNRAYNYAGHTLDLGTLMADSATGLVLAPTTASIFNVTNNSITGSQYGATFLAPAGAAFSFTGQ